MNRRIVLVLVAVVLALAGTFAVYNYAHNADKRAINNTRAAKVLYAVKEVPAGTSWATALKDGYFSQEKVPVESAPSNAVPSVAASIPVDEVATGMIPSGQIVVREMFASKSVTTGILAVPKGLMAISVSLPSNADVAGFVQNSSEVAIFSTFKLAKPANTRLSNIAGGTDIFTTKLLLPRVSVLAVSHDAPKDVSGTSNDNNSSTNVLVTLAVTQADAERLILAQQIGQLYLGLLSDTSVTSTDGGIVNIMAFNPAPIFVK